MDNASTGYHKPNKLHQIYRLPPKMSRHYHSKHSLRNPTNRQRKGRRVPNKENRGSIEHKRNTAIPKQHPPSPYFYTLEDSSRSFNKRCSDQTEHHTHGCEVVKCCQGIHLYPRWTEENLGESESDCFADDAGTLDYYSDDVEVQFSVGRDEDTGAYDADRGEYGEIDSVEPEGAAYEEHDDGAD